MVEVADELQLNQGHEVPAKVEVRSGVEESVHMAKEEVQITTEAQPLCHLLILQY